MPGVRTNEVPGTRAVLRHYRMSAYKAREVLDLVRGKDADRAEEILHATPRDGARVVAKVLASAVANARNNDQLDPDELYDSSCYADEGSTLKRWRPRARGRATRIRKRTCHITVIVSRLPEDRLERKRTQMAAAATAMRSRRVAASRRDAERRAETETGESEEELAAVDEGTGSGDDGDTTAPDATDEATTDEATTDEAVLTQEPATGDDEVEEETSGGAVAAEESLTTADEETAGGEQAEREVAAKPRRARKSTKKATAETEDRGDAPGSDDKDKD
jgi:large subunit ribosomal protein L22